MEQGYQRDDCNKLKTYLQITHPPELGTENISSKAKSQM